MTTFELTFDHLNVRFDSMLITVPLGTLDKLNRLQQALLDYDNHWRGEARLDEHRASKYITFKQYRLKILHTYLDEKNQCHGATTDFPIPFDITPLRNKLDKIILNAK